MHQVANTFFIIYLSYHFLVGIPGILSVNVTRVLAYRLYKLKLEDSLDLKYQYSLKCLGFYALYTAVLCYIGIIVDDPLVKSKLLGALGVLTLLRALGRWTSRELIQNAFSLKPERNRFHILLNGGMALAMFFVSYQLTIHI